MKSPLAAGLLVLGATRGPADPAFGNTIWTAPYNKVMSYVAEHGR